MCPYKREDGTQDKNAEMDGEWRHGGAPRGAGGWDGTSVNRMIAETAGEPLKLGEARKGFIPAFRGICVTLLTPGCQASSLQDCETVHFCHLMPPRL